MLVLTRKHQEQIQIGDNVTITILKVKGRTVRLGIEAPRDVRVIRGELPRRPVAAADCMTEQTVAERASACPAAHGRETGRSRSDERRAGADPAAMPHAGRGAMARSPLSLIVRDTLRTEIVSAVAQ